MKKTVQFFIIIFLSLVLSGCIDIFQYITKDENGIHRNTIKVSVSKAVFEMANSFSDSDDKIDYEKLFDESSSIDKITYNQFNATIKPINDMMDFGYLFDMSLDYQDKSIVNEINRSNSSFMPKYNGKNIVIHIDCLSKEPASTDDNGLSDAFLSTGKYRLIISKKCIANIDRVALKIDGLEEDIDFIDLYDEYLIEISMPIIFLSDVDIMIYSKQVTDNR
jgi:hypothetical protein